LGLLRQQRKPSGKGFPNIPESILAQRRLPEAIQQTSAFLALASAPSGRG